MMTQSSLSTGTWLLGFRGSVGVWMSHICTEDDREAFGTNSTGSPKEGRCSFLMYRAVTYQRA